MAVLSINETTTYRWSFEEDVEQYARAGIPAIGIWRRKVADFGEEKAAELLSEHKLQVSHLCWAGGFTGSDGRTYRESLDDAMDAVRLAAELRASCLVLYSGSRAGHTYNHARRLLREALKELAPVADQAGVTLAIEPMHPGCSANWTFLTSIDEALLVLDGVGPGVKLVFDVYHLGQQRENIERLAELTPRLALVQLADARQPPDGEQNRCRLGDGMLPLAEIIERLRTAGYDGFYDVELVGEEIERSDYHGLLTHSQEVYRRLLDGCP